MRTAHEAQNGQARTSRSSFFGTMFISSSSILIIQIIVWAILAVFVINLAGTARPPMAEVIVLDGEGLVPPLGVDPSQHLPGQIFGQDHPALDQVMPDLAGRHQLYLADALAGASEQLSDLFQRVIGLLREPEHAGLLLVLLERDRRRMDVAVQVEPAPLHMARLVGRQASPLC